VLSIDIMSYAMNVTYVGMSSISTLSDVCGVLCASAAVLSKYFSFSLCHQFHASVIVLTVGPFDVVVPSDSVLFHTHHYHFHHIINTVLASCVSKLGFLVILG